ncbi:MAG: lipopolysaccharide kinase InaA family protein [Bacteroidales bacterium]|nr:lipopolysaccharide kinase InaA family protein [Bacteroidales bacterium]
MSTRLKIVINPALRADEALASLIARIPDHFEEMGQEVFRKRNVVRRLPFPAASVPVMAVKRYKKLGWLRAVFYSFMGRSKAERAYCYALEMTRRGVATPLPVAYIERRRCSGLITESYFISAWQDLRPIKEGLHDDSDYRPAMALDFAHFMANVHRQGILHHDLNSVNALWSQDADGHYSFSLIDNNRMAILPPGKEPTTRQCIENLSKFAVSEKVVRGVAEAYVAERGWPQERVNDIVNSTLDFNLRRNKRRQVKARLKKLWS